MSTLLEKFYKLLNQSQESRNKTMMQPKNFKTPRLLSFLGQNDVLSHMAICTLLSVEFVVRWKGKIKCYLLNRILWLSMQVVKRLKGYWD
jgi:hypothetical protein